MKKVTLEDLQYFVQDMYREVDEIASLDATEPNSNPYTNSVDDEVEFRNNMISGGFNIYHMLFELYLQKFEEYGGKSIMSSTNLNTELTDEQMMNAIREQGYTPLKVKRWRDGDVYITIRRVSTKKLEEISEWARKNLGENVIICQPY